ncbi:MAG: ABC transporter ATP-binding protein [Synergistaceae bacterium]|nr:ABC transporter ATP-binding protein [Synergistaceae bacterium]
MIEIQDLSINLGTFQLNSLSLKVEPGEFFMVVGPSGAGKTILLEAIAGLRPLVQGKITVAGRDITDLPPEKRNVALVYQDYALFPHMSVLHNIEWGLNFVDKPDKKRVNELIGLFRLESLLARSPETLSGGEQQRVSLARALAVKPTLLLLDEPLSALDPSFREELSDYLAEINKAGMTIIMVTHDFGEVLSLGNRVAVITDGTLQQTDDVRTVFKEPANRRVAEFVGMKNLIECDICSNRASVVDYSAIIEIKDGRPERKALLGIRPEDILVSKTCPLSKLNTFRGKAVSLIPRGMVFDVTVQTESRLRLTANVLSSDLVSKNIRAGEECWINFDPESVHIF